MQIPHLHFDFVVRIFISVTGLNYIVYTKFVLCYEGDIELFKHFKKIYI
jgi:hypothetical protein